MTTADAAVAILRRVGSDLAGRALGGSVIYANDELFAERENLIKAEEPVFQPHTFGHKGQIRDGFRARATPAEPWRMIVRQFWSH